MRDRLVSPNDPILTQEAAPVTDWSEAEDIEKELLTVLEALPEGIGLAAPQIGIPRQICVIRCMGESHTLVNPVMTFPKGVRTTISVESCLSAPGIERGIPRQSAVDVTYWTAKGVEKKKTFRGYMAIIVQHEIDHLRGSVIFET